METPTLRSQKGFFKNVAIGAQSLFKFAATPQRRPAGYAVHGFWRCGPFATVDATQTQRRTFVSRCVGTGSEKILRHAGDLEAHGCCGVARFLECDWKLFWVEFQKLGLNKISRISDSVLAC